MAPDDGVRASPHVGRRCRIPSVWASCGTQGVDRILQSAKLSGENGKPVEVNTDSPRFIVVTWAFGSKKASNLFD